MTDTLIVEQDGTDLVSIEDVSVVVDDVTQLILDIEQGPSGPAGDNIEAFPFGKTLVGTYVGPFPLPLNGPYSFESIDVRSDVAILGQPLILDVLLGGVTSLWSGSLGNRPTIAVGTLRAVMAGAPTTATFVDGDFLTFSVPQFGSNSTVNLQGNLRLRRTA